MIQIELSEQELGALAAVIHEASRHVGASNLEIQKAVIYFVEKLAAAKQVADQAASEKAASCDHSDSSDHS